MGHRPLSTQQMLELVLPRAPLGPEDLDGYSRLRMRLRVRLRVRLLKDAEGFVHPCVQLPHPGLPRMATTDSALQEEAGHPEEIEGSCPEPHYLAPRTSLPPDRADG